MGDGSEGFVEEAREVMETPEKCKNCHPETPIGKFEDSPIFNFINSLSPIKPVKSTHISQTINPLSFASLPSVFTSPHLNRLRESRFLQRDQLSDPSKPEFPSGNGIKVDLDKGNVDASNESDEQKENLEPEAPDCEITGELSNECSKLVAEFVENINRDCYSPEPSSRSSDCVEAKHLAAECSWKSSAPAIFTEDASQKSLLYRIGGGNVEGLNQIEPEKEVMPCDWEGSLIPDTSDALTFESHEKPVDPATSFYTRIKNAVQNMHSAADAFSGDKVGAGNERENLSARLGEDIELMENATVHDSINSSEKMEDEQFPGFYRGMRRRCLVFEMAGVNQNRLEESPGPDSSLLLQSGGSTSSSEQILLSKSGNDFLHRALPGIGLHLNTLAGTPKGYKIVSHDASASGRLLIGRSLPANFLPQTSGQDLFGSTLVDSMETEMDLVETGVLPLEDPCRESGHITNEDNHSFPKKKRRRLETSGDGESCKRCNCKKSKCLKLYCECFAAGVFCVEPCACIDCFNKPIHEDTVLATRKQIESRNPLAFAPKVIRGSDSSSEMRDDFSKTPASARHKRGCNCKKSGCLKKYCECYQGGVGCSINCRCEGCKNTFGRKNGSGIIRMDSESEEEETDAAEKAAVDRPTKTTKIPNIEQNMDSVPPATPSRTGGQLLQPFSSKRKLPGYSFPSICSSSGFSASQGLRMSSFFPALPKFDQQLETVREEDVMPEFLQGVQPPIGSIKSSSPNRKRVSPPQRLGTLSTGLRSSRKLILQSIPSFPSLTSNQ